MTNFFNLKFPKNPFIYIAVVELIVILGVIFIGILNFSSGSTEVLYQSQKPESIQYTPNALSQNPPYILQIRKQSKILNERYYLTIETQSQSIFTIDTPLPGEQPEYIDFSKTSTNWTQEGVEVTFPPQTRLFIPKNQFVIGK